MQQNYVPMFQRFMNDISSLDIDIKKSMGIIGEFVKIHSEKISIVEQIVVLWEGENLLR